DPVPKPIGGLLVLSAPMSATVVLAQDKAHFVFGLGQVFHHAGRVRQFVIGDDSDIIGLAGFGLVSEAYGLKESPSAIGVFERHVGLAVDHREITLTKVS